MKPKQERERERARLFLVDGSNLAYRSYWALARTPLSTTKGEPTSAVYGFASTLWLLVRDYGPEYMAVVFDSSKPTFRHEAFKEYKAKRQEMPSELALQFRRIHELVAAFPLATCSIDGVEADDIMGAYATQLAGPDLEVVLVSGDKDFCQLVGDHIRILNLGRGGAAKIEAHWLDAEGVKEKFGVPPGRVIDVLALMGDASDGVPGVPGIGEKTASALIVEFGTLENVLASIDQVKKKSVQEKLRAYADQAIMSKDLVRIRTDIELPCELKEMETPPPGPGLVEFFREMEFTRLIREAEARIAGGGESKPEVGAPGSRARAARGTPAADVTGAAAEADGAPGADGSAQASQKGAGRGRRLPTTAAPAAAREASTAAPASAAPDNAAPVGAAEAAGSGSGPLPDLFDLPPATGKAPAWIEHVPPTSARYRVVSDEAALNEVAERIRSSADGFAIAVAATSGDALRSGLAGIAFSPAPGEAFYIPISHENGPNLPLDAIRERLGPVLSDAGIRWAGHDIKADLEVLRRNGLDVRGTAFDTMVASYLVESERSHRLENMAHDLIGVAMIPETDIVGRGASRRTASDVPVPLACRWLGERADVALRLAGRLRPMLAERGLDDLFRNVEMPLLFILRDIEERGVRIDVAFLEAMSARLGHRMQELENLAHSACSEEFNLNSPLQLGRVLFERLKLPRARKTKTGYSTDNDVLEGLARLHPLPRLVLDWRQLAKLKSTYVDALPRLIDPRTGRLHTCFNQTVAATGRLSSSDPNLQNIPIRTELGRDVRRAFVAGDDSLLLISADYSQIELRIMAHLSRDERLIDYVRRGVDVHRETAASIFNVAPEDVTRDQRGSAKTVNYAITYGQGPVGLSQQIGVSREEAALFIAAYRAQYPGVSRFLEKTIAEARECGYVSTLLKRRRYLPNLTSHNGRLRAEAERMAINTPIQGSAADMIKLAMIRVHRELREFHPDAHLLLQVHDELLLEAPAAQAEAAAARVKAAMEEALPLDVPVAVDVGIGRDWASIH